jgi:16S rRNA (adenine1518-N6/adenine1519-N6)-dimethyltransferase
MSSKKQTLTFLQRRFREVGFGPQSRHGQNFLIDLNLLDMIAREADIHANDVVLEVGTGTGSLTVRLAEVAGHVVTVELDPYLAQMALEQFSPDARITLLQQDALYNKNILHPTVLATLRERLSAIPGSRLKLVANLPYSVATPIISNLILCDTPPASMTVTIQKELAERIVAPPRTKDYSSLSVWVQSQYRAEIVREMAPSVFWPRPKVYSAILHAELQPDSRASLGNLHWFHFFVRHLFLHRRKFLRGSLLSSFKDLEKPQVDQIMRELEMGPETRAEELPVETIRQLALAVGRVLPAETVEEASQPPTIRDKRRGRTSEDAHPEDAHSVEPEIAGDDSN